MNALPFAALSSATFVLDFVLTCLVPVSSLRRRYLNRQCANNFTGKLIAEKCCSRRPSDEWTEEANGEESTFTPDERNPLIKQPRGTQAMQTSNPER